MYHDMRVLMALALQAMLLTATACVAIPELEHVPSPTPDLADRSDCGEILGSAFRSDNEQAWFTDNCSDWAHTTVGRLPDPTPVAQPAGNQAAGQGGADPGDQSRGSQVAQAGNQPDQNNQNSNQNTQSDEDTRKRCDEQRGRPYASAADRDWYLKNCQNLPATTLSPDVRDCDQIRGQNYASEEQRQWFLANCLNQGPANPGAANNGQAQDQGNQNVQGSTGPGGPTGDNSNQGPSDAGAASQPAIGPEGRPCSEIYGTRYRSPSERVWFSQNC